MFAENFAHTKIFPDGIDFDLQRYLGQTVYSTICNILILATTKNHIIFSKQKSCSPSTVRQAFAILTEPGIVVKFADFYSTPLLPELMLRISANARQNYIYLQTLKSWQKKNCKDFYTVNIAAGARYSLHLTPFAFTLPSRDLPSPASAILPHISFPSHWDTPRRHRRVRKGGHNGNAGGAVNIKS